MFGANIGPGEIAIVLLIALLIFGPKKLPELGRSLGQGMRDFKRGVTGEDEDDRKREAADKTVAEIPPPPGAPLEQTSAATTPATNDDATTVH